MALGGGIVSCLVGAEQFALRAEDVRMVGRTEQIIPGRARGGRLGLLRFGGREVPVFGLATLLGLPEYPLGAGAHVVVIEGETGPYAIAVDRAVRSARTDHLEPMPLPSLAGSVPLRRFAGLIAAGDISCLLLRPGGIDPAASPAEPVRTQLVTRATAHNGVDQGMAVIFSTAALPGTRGDRYALGARQIAAIVQTLPSVALPGAPAFVQAIAAWRGVAVPVVDFTGSAGLSAGRHLIARTATGEFVAIPVNADVVLHRAAAADQRIAVAGPRFVRGTFVIDGEQVGLVDIDALVRSDTHAASACVA